MIVPESTLILRLRELGTKMKHAEPGDVDRLLRERGLEELCGYFAAHDSTYNVNVPGPLYLMRIDLASARWREGEGLQFEIADNVNWLLENLP